MKVEDVKAATFDELLASEQMLLADFWAPWCGPCRMVGPVLEQIAEDYRDICRFVKINIDEEPSLADRYGIQAIPSVLVFREGKLAHTAVGAMPRSEYIQLLDKAMKG